MTRRQQQQPKGKMAHTPHDFDCILKQVGDFGLYQWVMYVMLCLPASLPSAFTAFNQVFVAAVPDHWCSPAPDAPAPASPLMELREDKQSWRRAQCDMYNTTAGAGPNATMQCQYGWTYDNGTYMATIATSFDLVCERSHWTSTSTMMFYIGSFIGNILFGYVADRWGRRVSFFSILSVQVIFGTLNAFAPNVYAFVGLRFCVGLTFPALYQIAFIVGMEMMGPSARIFSGMVVCIFFGVAMCLLGIVAWVLQHWVYITLVSNTPFVLLYSYYFFLPESPRWLATVGRAEEASKTLAKAGRWNGKPVEESVLLDECRRLYEKQLKESHKDRERPNLADLFRTPNLRRKTIIITWTWLVNAVVYNGLTLNVSNLPLNDYLSFVINGLIELPAYFLLWPLLDVVGRRWPLVSLMLFGGVCCLSTVFVPQEYGTVISGLAFAGKFGIAGSFSVIYIFAGELYPTVIRALGMGMSSMVAGSGLILGPYLVQLSQIAPNLPILVMGCLMVSAGCASAFLPETLGSPLPQTIADAEHYGTGFPFCYFPDKNQKFGDDDDDEEDEDDDDDNVEDRQQARRQRVADAIETQETVELMDIDKKAAAGNANCIVRDHD